MSEALIHKFDYPVTVWDLNEHEWHHNPSIAKDKQGKIWVSTRHHEEETIVRYTNTHPYTHPPSRLMVGLLDAETLEVSGVKRIYPEGGSPRYLLEKEIEDCRIFFREDGLHGIGVAINEYDFPNETRVYQIEILIDYEKGTYKLLRDWGYTVAGHMEKNWSPATDKTDKFDFIYSASEILKDDHLFGDKYLGKTHGGSQLLPYKDGYIRFAHRCIPIKGVTHRWYVSIAQLLDSNGVVTHDSQLFDFCTGWRPNIQESVEFISGAVWSGDDIIISYGLRDETCAFVKVNPSVFEWHPFENSGEEFEYKFADGIVPTDEKYWLGEKFPGSFLLKEGEK